jgi:hypothetical protein
MSGNGVRSRNGIVSWMSGDPGAIASSGVASTGRSSYSTSTSSQAAAAASSSTAITAATGSPLKRTRSIASSGRSGITGP